MRLRARITSTSLQKGVRTLVDARARAGVEAGARGGAEVARAVAGSRVKTGRMASIGVEPTRRTAKGVAASFVSPARHAWYQNEGTLGNRPKPPRSPSRSARSRAPGTGIKPLYFLNFGLGAGRSAMYRVLRVSGTKTVSR